MEGDAGAGGSDVALRAHGRRVRAGPRGAGRRRWGAFGLRRNHVITAPGGGAIDLGLMAVDSVRELPTDGYIATSFAADTAHPAIGKWYLYSMWSHLLTSMHPV